MRVENMIGKILQLYEAADREHGTTNGVRSCAAESEIEALRNSGKACSRCLAREQLELIEQALQL